ncbi:hypothetical protein [Halodesulfovibrio marinisediminis]|uniref:Uncharacterized protein n=1 Tax=Halodesulfovibrio marinisediminis DSM 17456 TaxID=1121457 RepID=A0A1N6EBW6_9BACT|nr:hypothetical protein [Halodesulfovibrio marinisediminis]SIN80407.1 hypothetical protein SAMN02745161_0865 [Halodesulfovibrio marinisediminis DSM 17456]
MFNKIKQFFRKEYGVIRIELLVAALVLVVFTVVVMWAIDEGVDLSVYLKFPKVLKLYPFK